MIQVTAVLRTVFPVQYIQDTGNTGGQFCFVSLTAFGLP